MSAYSVVRFDDVPDVLGDYPGEMRMLTYSLDAEKVAVTVRRMPPQTGGKGSYGHSHREAEEIYVVMSGTVQFKVGDDVFDLGPQGAVRVAPDAVRSVWNEGPEDAWLVIASQRVADPREDFDTHDGFWPE